MSIVVVLNQCRVSKLKQRNSIVFQVRAGQSTTKNEKSGNDWHSEMNSVVVAFLKKTIMKVGCLEKWFKVQKATQNTRNFNERKKVTHCFL